MNFCLLLVNGRGEVTTSALRARTLREFPGLEGLSVHFRPIRNDALFESAKFAGQLAYRILSGEGIVRNQLWVEYEVLGEPLNVTGRSSDLLFALALLTSKWNRLGAAQPAIAATGVLDAQGAVQAVERTAEKVAAAVRELASSSGAIVFYPLADAALVEAWRTQSDVPSHIVVRPVAHLEEALSQLGYVLEKVYLRNPFRGLEHFDYEHHSIFFGRDAEVQEFIRQVLRREAAGVPGLLVEGPSGSGKSSFLRAGVLPALVNPQHQPDEVHTEIARRPVCAGVRRAIWRPGLMPTGIQEAAIVRSILECWSAFSEWAPGLHDVDDDSLAGLAQTRRKLWPASLRFVWVIDQFEEVLNLGLSDQTIETLGQFLAQLQADGVWTLACVRADAMARLKRHDTIRRVFGSNEGQYYLPTLSGLALDDVITRPAKAADLTFGLGPDGKRLDKLLREEAYREQDSLPLLQYTLNELYLRRSAKQLTYAAYQELGGLTGSIATTAQRILSAQTAESTRSIRRLFGALVSVDDTGRATRRYAALSELTDDPVQKDLVTRLVEARLCITDQRAGESVVAFAHDSLLRTLPALIDWLKEEASLLQTREHALRETRLWQQHDQSPAWLAASDKAAAFKGLEAAEVILPADVRAFINRSQRHVLRTRRIKQGVVCLIAVLALAASIAAFIASRKEREAEYQTAQTQMSERRLLTEAAAERLKDGDFAYARGVVLEVLRHGDSSSPPDPAAVTVFQEIRSTDPARAILVGHDGPVRRASYSPDGTRIVTASYDGTARIWDAHTGIELLVLSHGDDTAVFTAAFSRDGGRVVTASSDRTARIWDARTGRQLLVLSDTERPYCAAFSPDGSRVATVTTKELQIWDASSGARLATFASPGVSFGSPHRDSGYRGSVVFSPDGSRIVTAMDDNTARVWDARTGATLAVLSGHTDAVATADYSPDGKRIVTGGDHSARVWDAITGRQLLVMSELGLVWSAEFSPDGKTIATSSPDKTARLWDAATGAQLQVFAGHTNILHDAQFSPDGSYLVTAGWEGVAREWALSTDSPARILTGHDGHVGSVAFSPDGSRLVTSASDKTVRIWDVRSAKTIAVLHANNEQFNSAVFSPDGMHVVTASDDKTARIWDATTGKELTVLPGPAPVFAASYSPDGQRVVGSFANFTFGVWDVRAGTLGTLRAGHRDGIGNVSFSPDGSRILTSSVDKTARLWDSTTLTPLAILQHSDFVNTAEFSSDGTRIVTSTNDGTARIWDARTAQQTVVLSGHRAFVYGAAFSPDGSRVVTGSTDKTVRIWDAHTGTQLAALMGHSAGVNDVSFSPDGALVASGSKDTTARIWDARIVADFPSQVLWEEAAEADPLSNVQRTQGMAPTAALLADSTIKSYALAGHRAAFAAARPSPCDIQAAAFYDPDRHAQGVVQDSIDGDTAVSVCTPLAAAKEPSARAHYQLARGLIAKQDMAGARDNLELAISKGYRVANVDLAMLLSDPAAKMLDTRRAISLYEQAWKQGVHFAGYQLGRLYEHGVPAADGTAALAPDPDRAWLWYQQASAVGQPNAVGRFAERDEKRALEASSARERSTLFLDAFKLYTQAAKTAGAEEWPDLAWRAWRYRRSTLARLLASEGRMQEVADAYRGVIEVSQPNTARQSVTPRP